MFFSKHTFQVGWHFSETIDIDYIYFDLNFYV